MWVFFFLLGIISVIGQAVLLREITTLFYGNEMFYGLGLGTWLVFTGLGSLLAIKFKFLKNKRLFLWLILGILFILLPGLIVFLRWLVAKIVPPGALPSFWFTFFVLDSIFFLFCFPLGALFALGTSKLRVNRAYFWETIGFALGGLLFSFILSTVSFPYALSKRFPGLVKVINSKYQQILISEKEGQKNYFLSGQLVFTNQESFENQQLLSLIKPFERETKQVLVLGNPNLVSEIKNSLSPEKILFLEIDSRLLELERDLLPEGVDLVSNDPRKFLKESSGNWDLVIFSLGNPQTLLTNRYFTKECFEEIKNRLTGNGIFVLLFYLPTDYQSQEALRFGASIYQTLRSVFPVIELLTPEDQLIFFAGQNGLEIDQQKIDRKLADYFWYQIKNPKRNEILERLKKAPTKINRDFEPTSFFYSQLFWQTIFSFRVPSLILKTVRILPGVLLALLFFFLLYGNRNLRLGLSMGSSSFILMSLETLLIFIFQTKIGYLYSQISLIFASVLIGMGIGVILIENFKFQISNFKFVFLGYLPFLILVQQTNYWPLIGLGIGLTGGIIFATLNRIYLQKAKHTGFIYAFDLFGGVIGAFLTSAFLLPVFGLRGLAGILVTVFLINFLVFTAKPLK